ncbi:small cysteine-rich extracellular protein [Volvox carteri f. nagariensis]|uniref:Small cysteine-rich extracellular protein n=1 Tax=Volvox carteri f. nagariensis TaxID=3068 RepID=A4ZG68_VOLCA|nr:small cysteine-rich extracellular protein [Volvox carteri f. nagariensis]ABF67974.1 small cysteine-rich extracellular protein VCRP1 precursor [Volvox carteri f. nagariensis]ABF67975.1 small cysteine-rich extracellular protein VCRP1 precursor [Volvox carteri f. nagariensis]EFJ52649.1 small cysteine-rich extracellular protein [Volvox carteri f. nagariensis]|eukprot:XP_002945654.1 small cysteine-rich extracellular protein [Volvox carteri f. nagariensis]
MRSYVNLLLALCAIAMSATFTAAAGDTHVQLQESGVATITTTTTVVMHKPHEPSAANKFAAVDGHNGSQPLGGMFDCAKLAFKCGKAAYQAYKTHDKSALLQCASVSSLCDCVSAFYKYSPSVADFMKKYICPGPSMLQSAPAAGGCPAGYDRIPADGQWCYSRHCPPTYSLIESTSEDEQKRCYRDCDLGWEDRGTTCYVSAHMYKKDCCCLHGCCGCNNTYTDSGCECWRAKDEKQKEFVIRPSVLADI